MSKTKIGSNAQFTGPNNGLTIIGKHCYAYNIKAVSTSATVHLSFTTGKEYITGILTCNGAVDMNNVDRGQVTGFQLKFNGSTVAQVKVDTETEDMPTQARIDLLIPPLTDVELNADSDGATFGFTSASFVGELHG
tara:strand:+ start:178 stop:585 length:408 start_codon:yes stop_codon:yes gene_type:complete